MIQKNLSEHLSIYSGQFFNLVSILARLSIVFFILVPPAATIVEVFYNDFIFYNFIVLFFISLIYHLFHY